METFYYFCKACGGDTAAYERYSSCPYCHAGRKDLQLIGDTRDSVDHKDILLRLEQVRSQWNEEHKGSARGERPRRRFLRRRA